MKRQDSPLYSNGKDRKFFETMKRDPVYGGMLSVCSTDEWSIPTRSTAVNLESLYGRPTLVASCSTSRVGKETTSGDSPLMLVWEGVAPYSVLYREKRHGAGESWRSLIDKLIIQEKNKQPQVTLIICTEMCPDVFAFIAKYPKNSFATIHDASERTIRITGSHYHGAIADLFVDATSSRMEELLANRRVYSKKISALCYNAAQNTLTDRVDIRVEAILYKIEHSLFENFKLGRRYKTITRPLTISVDQEIQIDREALSKLFTASDGPAFGGSTIALSPIVIYKSLHGHSSDLKKVATCAIKITLSSDMKLLSLEGYNGVHLDDSDSFLITANCGSKRTRRDPEPSYIEFDKWCSADLSPTIVANGGVILIPLDDLQVESEWIRGKFGKSSTVLSVDRLVPGWRPSSKPKIFGGDGLTDGLSIFEGKDMKTLLKKMSACKWCTSLTNQFIQHAKKLFSHYHDNTEQLTKRVYFWSQFILDPKGSKAANASLSSPEYEESLSAGELSELYEILEQHFLVPQHASPEHMNEHIDSYIREGAPSKSNPLPVYMNWESTLVREWIQSLDRSDLVNFLIKFNYNGPKDKSISRDRLRELAWNCFRDFRLAHSAHHPGDWDDGLCGLLHLVPSKPLNPLLVRDESLTASPTTFTYINPGTPGKRPSRGDHSLAINALVNLISSSSGSISNDEPGPGSATEEAVLREGSTPPSSPGDKSVTPQFTPQKSLGLQSSPNKESDKKKKNAGKKLLNQTMIEALLNHSKN